MMQLKTYRYLWLFSSVVLFIISCTQSPKTLTNSIGMEFVLIPAGQFMMGAEPNDREAYDGEKPRHEVTIAKPFYLGKYEITQEQWQKVMGDNPSDFKDARNPVEIVSWDDLQAFVKRLNEMEQTDKYRLPSEAEWEYTARAGTQTVYSFGDDKSQLGDYAWYDDNSKGKTHPVGTKNPNPWGLYDMHGNVSEWCQDKRHNTYQDTPTDGSAWEQGDSNFRIFRGGSWGYGPRRMRGTSRQWGAPDARGSDVGGRLARNF